MTNPQRVVLRDGSTVADVRLDRLIEFDDRSREFAIRQFLDPNAKVSTRLWDLTAGDVLVCLDQGREGACTGFGTTNELRFNPVPVRKADGKLLDAMFAREHIYWEAQKADPWPGGAYPGATPFYEGTSVISAVKRMAGLGFYTEYRWAFGEADLALAVSNVGPAVLGLNWYQGMFKPNQMGYIKPTGSVQGGHCILCIGYDAERKFYTLYNSWGPSWGKKGTCKVSKADMTKLLKDNGEACVITGRAVPAGYIDGTGARSTDPEPAAEEVPEIHL